MLVSRVRAAKRQPMGLVVERIDVESLVVMWMLRNSYLCHSCLYHGMSSPILSCIPV